MIFINLYPVFAKKFISSISLSIRRNSVTGRNLVYMLKS